MLLVEKIVKSSIFNAPFFCLLLGVLFRLRQISAGVSFRASLPLVWRATGGFLRSMF